MGEHNREAVHHGVHMAREGCQRTGRMVGFQAHRMERAEGFTGSRDGWTFVNVAPVRATHEEAWADMWAAGDEFWGSGYAPDKHGPEAEARKAEATAFIEALRVKHGVPVSVLYPRVGA